MAKKKKKTIKESLTKPAEGLGDVVAKVIHSTADAVGIKLNKGCKTCNSRFRKLNEFSDKLKKALSFKPEDITEDEYTFLKATIGTSIRGQEKTKIETIYRRLFRKKSAWKFGTCPQCGPKNMEALAELNAIVESYELK